jgi:hypothetical protein
MLLLSDDEMELLRGFQELRNIDDIIGDTAQISLRNLQILKATTRMKIWMGKIVVYGDFSDSEDK